MPIIKKLSSQEAQKIAAGEVVERPANVVKELIENALDAGATALTIFLEEGGKKLIHIIDDGSGMEPADARLCIEHHATSKISGVDDLASLTTHGFRGEALSSIASVSKMTIITKRAEDSHAIQLTIERGIIVTETVCSAQTGTQIKIEDIFFNVPARRKFLKTKETEWRAINQLFHALALSYPHISFKLYHDRKLLYQCPHTETLIERVSQLYPTDVAESLLSFKTVEPSLDIQIEGALSAQTYWRYDKNLIFIFVNGRWVKNYKLVNAFIKGYSNMLQTDRFPAGIINITIDPTLIDVNIHPRKEEIQFLHPRIIEQHIEQVVSQRLHEYQGKAVRAHPIVHNSFIHKPAGQQLTSFSFTPTHSSDIQAPTAQESSSFLSVLNSAFEPTHVQTGALNVPAPQVQSTSEEHQQKLAPESLTYTLIGQVAQTYIVIETTEGITLIDQHAAHERILYETMRERFETIACIQLLFPQIVSLTKDDIALLQSYDMVLSKVGIAFEQISLHQIAITHAPVFLKNQSLEELIKQAITVMNDYSVKNSEIEKIILEHIHARMSCAGAVKAGDILPPERMHEIISQLYSLDHRLTCPHGRPTTWQLSIPEIEKRFKRNYK